MLLALANLFYRSKDPTKNWQADLSQLVVDIQLLTVCNVPLGADFLHSRIQSLGPSGDARMASKGYFHWPNAGISCVTDNGSIEEFTILLKPAHKGDRAGARHRRPKCAPSPARFTSNGQSINLSATSTADHLLKLLGEPWGQSNNSWDGAHVLFYEFPHGEAQFAFNLDDATLETIELWRQPELSQRDACKAYGIGKSWPPN